MTTKNIQDVVAELKEQKFYQYLQVAGFHKEAEDYLTQLVKEVGAERDKQWLLYLAKWHRRAHDDLFDPDQSDRPILSAEKIDILTNDAYKEQDTPPVM